MTAGSYVKGEHKDFSLIAGHPAKKVCDCRRFFVRDSNGKVIYPYPWPKHVSRHYPWSKKGLEGIDLDLEKYNLA
ncbi:MAG: hypothetical protein D6780_06455 [Candidatus Dadabacteria bacterium]|nr:MAG: hypothetical protein D6780_06455 [Candidatus Dadabacteria bacterium]